MSASECPANDWPRVTVNTPVTAEGDGDDGPDGQRDVHRPLPKKPGSIMWRRMFTMLTR